MKAKLSLGENLRLLREERGISQEALGQDLSLSDGAISRYENNAAEPDINTLFGMAEIFGVDFNYLLDYHGHVRKSQDIVLQNKDVELLTCFHQCSSGHQRVIRMLAKELARQDRLWPKLTELTSLETAGLVNEEKEAWVESVPEVEVKKHPEPSRKKKKTDS
jgi:transcriptional regulator with XRE-family HTH domain